MNMRPLRAHWPALAVLLVLAAAGVLRVFGKAGPLRELAQTVLTWVPIAFAVASYSYHRVEWFRLTANRLRFRVLNPEGKWGLTGDIEVTDPAEAWAAAVAAVEEVVAHRPARVLATEEHRRVWMIDGITVVLTLEAIPDLSYGEDGEKTLLRIEIPDQRRSFRSWNRTIERDAAPIALAVEKAAERYATDDRTFVARIGFSGENPYFGMFVSRLERAAVVRFNIEYFESLGAEQDRVRVRGDEMEIVTGSVNAARVLSLQYLALASPTSR